MRVFRAVYALPETFTITLFEPKDYSGLGRIDAAGAALHALSQTVLAAAPANLSPTAWIDQVDRLARVFEAALVGINDQIGLRPAEVGFAVAGFADVCRAYAYALIRAAAASEPPPNFIVVYGAWLNDSTRIGGMVYPYNHPQTGDTWRIQMILNAYGRVGLRVAIGAGVHYVLDTSLACPAEGFMVGLLREVAARMAGHPTK